MRKIFRRVLKVLFPVVWLKETFLIYNKLKIETLDRLLFPEYKLDRQNFIIKKDKKVYDQLNINEEKFSEDIRSRLTLWHGWTQDEYLLIFDKPCIIEPKQGWALADGKLIYPSLGFGRAAYIHKPSFFKLQSSNKKVVYIDEAISLRDTGEENYFHFYNDILAKLCFLHENLNLPYTIPIIVSKSLYYKPFFQYFLQHSSLLKNRQWIVQTDFYIQVKRTYFCKPLTHTKKYLDQIVHSLEINRPNLMFSDRIFLTRNPARLRFIDNMDEIRVLCDKMNLQIVDADELSLQQQINLFTHATLLVGIHGAGLTNMIYGIQSIQKVIEILPPSSYIPFHYIMLAHMYGYEYQAILGQAHKSNGKGGFTLSIQSLEDKLLNHKKIFI